MNEWLNKMFGNNSSSQTTAQAKKMHRKYARGSHQEKWIELTFTHSIIVEKIALRIAEKLENAIEAKIDKESLSIGAYLHDIGVYSCFDEDLLPDTRLPPYVAHGYVGYKILKKEGFPEKIARFAATHTGTGFTVQDFERENIPEYPPNNWIPVTLEEEILCYADKFHTKYPSFSTFEEQKARLEKYDAVRGIKMDIFKMKFGIPDLADLYEEFNTWNHEMDEFFKKLSK